ncbi:hypothetical protein [Flavobacterium sp.]|uniref:hypothetical protein n=1 Tax=Flavobacterium sp. TaxID=239 RepID=UPI0037512688
MNLINKIVFFSIILLSLNNLFSQNSRDLFIKDSIIKLINTNEIITLQTYNKVYNYIKKCDKLYNYESDLHKRFLEFSYSHGDIKNFKKDLSILVENYGFQIIYMNNKENYYETITKGSLSFWFKKMYLKNHLNWLKQNFEKQYDLKKINELFLKDQIYANLYSDLKNTLILDSLNQKKLDDIIINKNFENIKTLFNISNSRNKIPNSKNFAVIQNSYNTLFIHNLNDNIDKTWELFFPLFKKAYLNNEIDYTIFQNYDFYCYKKYGYQEFNSFKINQIPEQFRKNNNEIPLKNKDDFDKIKTEFKWY